MTNGPDPLHIDVHLADGIPHPLPCPDCLSFTVYTFPTFLLTATGIERLPDVYACTTCNPLDTDPDIPL